MKSSSPRSVWSRLPLIAALVAGMFLLGGCGNPFMPKHRVLVDAITLPGTPKPAGISYRLVARPSVVAAARVQVPVVNACLDAALAGQGMFPAADQAAPELFIEVSFGREAAVRVDPAVRETFLQLSARSNPQRSATQATGPEIWDVRVAVLGHLGAVESVMPMLASVAVNHMASDTRLESQVDVAQNDPIIEGIRQTAIRSLESKNPPAAAGTSGAPAAPSGASVLGPATR